MQRIRKDAKFADKIFAAKKLRLQKEAEEKAKMETKNTTDEDLENNVILVEIEQNTTE